MSRITPKELLAIYLLLHSTTYCIAISSIQNLEEELRNGAIIVTRPEIGDAATLGGRVMGVIDAPVANVWTTISDYNNIHNVMPILTTTFIVDKAVINEISDKSKWNRQEFERTLDKYRLDQPNSDTVYFYNVLNMPFFISDRWYLVEMIRDTLLHAVQWRLIIGNMVTNNGSWEFTEFNADRQQTLAIYTIYSDLGIQLPKFIIDLAQKKALPSVIRCLRNSAHQPAGN